MCKRLSIVFLAVLLALLITAPVLAAYYIDIDVTESNGTSYDMLAMNVSMDIDYLAEQGFISDDGLDVRIKDSQSNEVPFMLAADRILFASDITANMVNSFQMTTGNTPLDNFDICVGDGGYITITDHDNLELGSDFEIEFEGWVDTSASNSAPAYPTVAATATSSKSAAGTSHTVNLPSGIQAGDLLIVIFQTQYGSTHSVTWPTSGWTSLANYGGGTTRNLCIEYKVASGSEGSTITVTTSSDATSAHESFRITGYVGIPEISCDSSETSNDTPNPPSLTPSWGASPTLWIAGFGLANGDPTISSYPENYSDGLWSDITGCSVGTARRLWAASSENPGTYTLTLSAPWRAFTIGIRGIEPSPSFIKKSGAFYIYPNSGTLNAMIFTSTVTKTVTATIDSDEYIVNVWADGTNFGIDIDGDTKNSTALAGVTTPDNATNWVISIPYFNYYTHTTSDTLRITYEPDSIISGTTLPNEESPGTYDGTITWGSNPAGIAITHSGLEIEEGYYYTGTDTDTVDIFEPEPAQLITGMDADKLEHNPFYPLVHGIAQGTNNRLPESILWIGGAFFVLIAAGAALIILVREHLAIAAGVCFGLTWLFYFMGIFDYWLIIIFGILFGASLIHERMPTW